MTDTLRSILPDLYAPLLPDFFDTAVPIETKATCSNCAMCPSEGAPAGAGEVTYFRPDTKCCTFHPRLPNYLVGAILADERPDMQEGRRRIREKIARRVGVSPQWIAPPRKQEVLYDAARRNSFGRSLVLRCPYYEERGGLCTIWRQREVVCSTFFCKYVDGADGQHFWRSARAVIGSIEFALSQGATMALLPGWTAPPNDGLTVEDLEDLPPRAGDYAALWGELVGREEELYLRAYEWVRALDRGSFAEVVAGPAYATRFEAVVAAHQALVAPTLPERLQPNPEMTLSPAEGGHLVTTYSRYEPMLLSEGLHEVVREFSAAETVAEVRARLRRESEVELPEELLLSLLRFRVLVAPP